MARMVSHTKLIHELGQEAKRFMYQPHFGSLWDLDAIKAAMVGEVYSQPDYEAEFVRCGCNLYKMYRNGKR